MAFAMAFTMMASAAFTDQADITCEEAVEMLSALGVISGYEDGSFQPNGTVTRAEMAAMIYIIRNSGNKDASSFAGSKTTFTDVPADAWYAGYVKYCQSVNIISGRNATTFDPNGKVTAVEAALMCLRAMGYSAEKSDIGGSTWSITTIGLASENGILDDYTLYTYSEKDGDYSVEPIWGDEDNGNIGSYDELVASNGATTIKDGKTSEKYRFADDGVIFVNDKDGVKVVTGKAVSGWKEINVDSVIGLADETNGTMYIAVGAIELGNKTAKTDTRVYGFVTSDISSSKEDGTNYLNFTMWDGSESVDVKVEDTGAAENVAKYDFVAFDWADEDAKEADSDDFLTKNAADDAVAITAFVTDDSIAFSDGTSLDFADDYFVIGVDTKKGEGSSTKLATAKDCPTDSDKYCANAIYFQVKDGDDDVIEAVFVDVSGVMFATDKAGTEIYIDK